MGQSIQGARTALFEACRDSIYATAVDSVDAPVLTVYGFPGTYQPQNIVAVGISTSQPVTRPTMTTNRSREKQCTVTVTISVFRAGDESAQESAADDCDDLVVLLETYFQTSPNERLSGSCRDSWVSSIDGPTLAPSYAEKRVIGYTATAVATVTIIVRY
jgi:hypothetical protein